MLTVEYDPDCGAPVRDGDVAEEVEYVIDMTLRHGSYYATYATENMFYALRHAVLDGLIPHTHLEFFFQGSPIEINKYAAIVDWPRGFCDLTEGYSAQILTKAMNMRRAERAGA